MRRLLRAGTGRCLPCAGMAGPGWAPPRLDGFVLTERLGSGTYATVYKAYAKVGVRGGAVEAEDRETEVACWAGRSPGGICGGPVRRRWAVAEPWAAGQVAEAGHPSLE